jgi:predicted HicB family RNase H-like nuclease
MVHSGCSECCLERYTMQKKIMVRMPKELHDAVNAKAERELRPVAAVVRRLLEKWLRGEIDIDEP